MRGRITRIEHRPGKYLNAELDKASAENERNGLLIDSPNGTVAVVQIAGLVARRIDPTNRRVVRVRITAAGGAMLEQVQAEWVDGMARVLSPLTSVQLQDLIVAMGHLDTLVDGET